MLMYYSGNGCNLSDPETVLRDKARIMLTFFHHTHQETKKLGARFARVYKARRRNRK